MKRVNHRLFAWLLAMALCLGVAVPVFAGEPEAKIPASVEEGGASGAEPQTDAPGGKPVPDEEDEPLLKTPATLFNSESSPGMSLEGLGTADDPLHITTEEQLAYIGELVNAGGLEALAADEGGPVYLKLMDDINLAGYGAGFDGGAGWIPIGTQENPFAGNFDGGGHQISGLYIRRGGSEAGLFGYTSGTVENLHIVSADIVGGDYTGGVAGYVGGGHIAGCSVSGSINGVTYVGGVAGRIFRSGSVTDCSVTGPVRGGDYVGGVVGQLYIGGNVERCYVTGTVSGGDNVGGVAGSVYFGGSMESCYATGRVNGGSDVGGVVGTIASSASEAGLLTQVASCYATGMVSGDNYVGGVAGTVSNINSTLRDCAALNLGVSSNKDSFRVFAGRVAGRSYGTLAGNIAWNGMEVNGKTAADGTADSLSGEDRTIEALQMADGFPAAFAAAHWSYEPGCLPGLGTAVPVPEHLTDQGVIVTHAQAPAITGHPQSGEHVENAAAAVAVEAEAPDGGTLSYQWYVRFTGGNSISSSTSLGAENGAQTAVYTPDTGTIGVRYYFCVVTNTNMDVNGTQTAAAISNAAKITVTATPVDLDTVTTEEELLGWLKSHAEGTVRLGGCISITGIAAITAPVTIDTGVYGLKYDGGLLAALVDGRGARIIGEGIDFPVVEVCDMGRIFTGDWNSYLSPLHITATGCNGVGGTALRIDGSGAGRFNLADAEEFPPGLIQSFGTDAVGIELTAPFDLLCFEVQAEGENSTAVLVRDSANIGFCKLSAIGAGAQSVRGDGEVTVDTCLVNPAPIAENFTIYQAGFIPTWYPVKQFSAMEELTDGIHGKFAMTALVGSGDTIKRYTPSVIWDSSYEDINLAEAGRTVVRGTLYAPWFADILPDPPEIIVNVRDPEAPCIYKTGTNSDIDGVDSAWFDFWMCESWALEDCILWYSDDGGESWRDITGEEGVLWTPADTKVGDDVTRNGSVVVPIALIDEDVMLVIEVLGFGQSNTVHYSAEYPDKLPDVGGDRIGTDRLGINLSVEKRAGPGVGNPPGNVINPPDDGDKPDDSMHHLFEKLSNREEGAPVPAAETEGTLLQNVTPGNTGGEAAGDPAADPGNGVEDSEPSEAPLSLGAEPVADKSALPLPAQGAAVQPAAVSPAPVTPASPEPAEAAKNDTPASPLTAEAIAETVAEETPPLDGLTASAAEAPAPLQQPALAEPSFPVGTAVAVCAAVALVAAAGWLLVKRPWRVGK